MRHFLHKHQELLWLFLFGGIVASTVILWFISIRVQPPIGG